MSFTPDMHIYLIGAVVAFCGGLSQGVAGFGFSLLFMSMMLAVIPPQATVPVGTVLAVILNVSIVYRIRKQFNIKMVAPLLIAGIAGIPFGALVLKYVDAGILKAFAGVFVVVFAAAYLAGFERKVNNERVASIWIGLLSGFLNGCVGFSGPPVVFFYANQKVPKDIFRANLAVYFFILNAITAIAFFQNGLLDLDLFKFSLSFVPPLILGLGCGFLLAGKVNDALFRKLVLCLVSVAGLIAAAGGLKLIGK